MKVAIIVETYMSRRSTRGIAHEGCPKDWPDQKTRHLESHLDAGLTLRHTVQFHRLQLGGVGDRASSAAQRDMLWERIGGARHWASSTCAGRRPSPAPPPRRGAAAAPRA